MSPRSALGISALVLLSACAREASTANPCTRIQFRQSFGVHQLTTLDLLFVVDNSGSMAEERASLAAGLPRMIYILATGDFDQDGDVAGDEELDDVDFAPPESLHVGVVTSDMGTGGYATATCEEPDFGDDGVLRRAGGGGPGCEATYPPFMRFDPIEPAEPASDFVMDVACVASTGTGGCGYEQPLEAALKALSPSAPTDWTAPEYVAPRFFRDTVGHGDTVNDGFVRSRSVLAIIPVTDEDDCSVRDPELFDDTGPYGTLPRNVRCSAHPEALHDVRRYVDGLLQLRRYADLLVYAPIVGIPVDLAPTWGESPAWDELICDDPATCDPRMLQEPDPTDPTRLRPSCDVPGRGLASPPTRLLRVGRDLEALGVAVTVHSICEESFDLALTEIIRQTSRWIGGGADCLPRVLRRGADGSVPCEARGLLPEGTECADVPGASPVLIDDVEVRERGRALCWFEQVVPADRSPGAPAPTEPGWFYDDFTPRGAASCRSREGESWQRAAFTTDPPLGTQLHLICLGYLGPWSDAVSGIGTFCDPRDDESCELGLSSAGPTLTCDALSQTCGVACTLDSDCRDAGFPAFVCDRRPLSELDARFESVTDARDLCVNPACGLQI